MMWNEKPMVQCPLCKSWTSSNETHRCGVTTSGSSAAPTHDPVNHPAHYTAGAIECIDAIEAQMSPIEFIGGLRFNVNKYMWRWREKGGLEDLYKALWCLQRLIATVEKRGAK